MPWRCSWWKPTDEVRVGLRRYRSNRRGDNCSLSGYGYHNAVTYLDQRRKARWKNDGGHRYLAAPRAVAEDDERWPTACVCGYEFVDDDERQVVQSLIYRSGKLEFADTDLPPGAMYDAAWQKYDGSPYVGPDGIALAVVLPPATAVGAAPHVWLADGPSSSGPGWERTGDPWKPETLSVQPSILTGQYHGFLTAGVLTDSLGDRPLPPGPD